MNTTIQQINNLIEFRQAVHQTGLSKSRDALFELVDALIERPHASCAADISLSPLFRRSWSSLYKAVETGQVNETSLAALFVRQVPTLGIHRQHDVGASSSANLGRHGLRSQSDQSPQAALDCAGA